MFRVITANLNGIRSAAQKGFFEWAAKQNADVVCVQEIRAQQDILHDTKFHLEGYHGYFHCAQKKGYSGVGIYSRTKPLAITTGLGWSVADDEGRYIEADLGEFKVASLYLPSGTSGDERQTIKYDFLDRYAKHLTNPSQKVIICGDWNIAHKQIDLKNWRGNQKNSGFLPEERAWMDQLLGNMGFVDAFREVNQEPDQYTWWSNRGQARAKNVGWRIDYQIISPLLKNKVKMASIYTEQQFSDHAPLLIDYEMGVS